jgi:hypothetical protein
MALLRYFCAGFLVSLNNQAAAILLLSLLQENLQAGVMPEKIIVC